MDLLDDDFSRYLNQPCSEPDCERTATHNQANRRVCNAHLDNGPGAQPAFARDD